MDSPFHIYLGDEELLNDAEISITDASKHYWLRSSSLRYLNSILVLLVNLNTNYLYDLQLFETNDGEEYRLPENYNYNHYPTDPGTYVFYIFKNVNYLTLENPPLIPQFDFTIKYKPSDFGELVDKIKFYVKPKNIALGINFNLLPSDLQKYLIEENFSIYEILDFCLSSPSSVKEEGSPSKTRNAICNSLSFWQLLVRNRLTTKPEYKAIKEQVIKDLIKVEYLLNYTPELGNDLIDPLVYFATFDILLTKLRKKWNDEQIYVSIIAQIYDMYEKSIDPITDVQEFDGIGAILATWFPTIEILDNDHLYTIIEKILAELTEYEFEISYEHLMINKYDSEVFRLFLDHIAPEDWPIEIAKYNQIIQLHLFCN
jgi:hypothetical protein